jgi:hypothetical protein
MASSILGPLNQSFRADWAELRGASSIPGFPGKPNWARRSDKQLAGLLALQSSLAIPQMIAGLSAARKSRLSRLGATGSAWLESVVGSPHPHGIHPDAHQLTLVASHHRVLCVVLAVAGGAGLTYLVASTLSRTSSSAGARRPLE